MNASPATAEPPTVKGWCPGALRPMLTGDGLIVRVRPRCGALSPSQMLDLAEIAQGYGNGLIDLTRRANLQLRGIAGHSLPEVWAALSRSGLIDASPDAESVRNVMVTPLAGHDPSEIADVRPIATALEKSLTETPTLWPLPGKFGFIVDGGGVLSLDSERADIRLRAVKVDGHVRMALGIDTTQGTQWLRLLDPQTAPDTAVRAAAAFLRAPKPHPRTRMRDLDAAGIAALQTALAKDGTPADHIAPHQQPTSVRIGLIGACGRIAAVGLGAPLGRVTAKALAHTGDAAIRFGIGTFRLSPWRALFVPAQGEAEAAALIAAAQNAGLVISPRDPLTAIDACPGTPACRSAWADTRAAARRIAAQMPLPGVGSVHISGCAKGCARSKPADLVLVACPSGFGIVRHGTAQATPGAVVTSAALDDLPAILRTWI